MQITDNCELDWASSAFLMVLRETRDKLPAKSQQEKARWWSQSGLGPLGMEPWNYWPGGSLGSPHTSLNSSCILTILKPPLKWQSDGSLPSSPAGMVVTTPLSKKYTTSTTLLLSLRSTDTEHSTKSTRSLPLSSTGFQMRSQPFGISKTPAAIAWRQPSSPRSCGTSKTATPSPPKSPSLEDTIETLLAATVPLMMEHLPREGDMSPLLPVPPPWVQWSNELAREMYVKRALEKLKLEYPDSVSDSDYLTPDP